MGEAALSEFKLDMGYTPTGDETSHDLYIGLLPETPWRYEPLEAG